MGKILTGLRELGRKMTGSEITSNRIGDAIREIASKYTGGGGGGSTLTYGCYHRGTSVYFFDAHSMAPIDDSIVYNKVQEIGAENVTFLMRSDVEGNINYYRAGSWRNSNHDFMFYSLYEKESDEFYGYCIASIQLMEGGSYFLETEAFEIPFS